MASFRSTATLSLAALAILVQAHPVSQAYDEAPPCDCYTADEDATDRFLNHKFFDFRSIANPHTPAPIADKVADQNAPKTHPYFSTPAWTDTWSIQSWNTPGSGVYRVNSANNVFIAADAENPGSTYLTLRTNRHNDYQSTAEVESVTQDYFYLSMRMLARTRGTPNAVTSLFTYEGRTSPIQEADIEFRTQTGQNIVQYTNQPGQVNGIPDPRATRVVSMATPWTQWQEHRYDWSKRASQWWVDGVKVAEIDVNVPNVTLSVIMNVWSDGGSWSGNMVPGGEAEMQVQWLDIAFNNSASKDVAGSCESACLIEDLLY